MPLTAFPRARRRRISSPFALYLLAPFLLAAATGPVEADDSRRVGELMTESIPATDLQRLEIDFPVGHLTVIGEDSDSIEVRFETRCERAGSRCLRHAGEVRLKTRRRGDRVTIDVDEWPDGLGSGLSLRGTIRVPRHLAVELDMGVGELDVEGLAGDVSVDLGVGELKIEANAADYADVEIEAGIGEASLVVDDEAGGRVERSGWIGRGAHWRRGPGRSTLEAEVGVGEIDVRVFHRDLRAEG